MQKRCRRRLLTTNHAIQPYQKYQSHSKRPQQVVVKHPQPKPRLKISDSLVKNPTYYNIPDRVPKKQYKNDVDATSSQLTVILKLSQD